MQWELEQVTERWSIEQSLTQRRLWQGQEGAGKVPGLNGRGDGCVALNPGRRTRMCAAPRRWRHSTDGGVCRASVPERFDRLEMGSAHRGVTA